MIEPISRTSTPSAPARATMKNSQPLWGAVGGPRAVRRTMPTASHNHAHGIPQPIKKTIGINGLILSENSEGFSDYQQFHIMKSIEALENHSFCGCAMLQAVIGSMISRPLRRFRCSMRCSKQNSPSPSSSTCSFPGLMYCLIKG